MGEDNFLCPVRFTDWGLTSYIDKRQINRNKGIQILFVVNFYETQVFLEKSEDSKKWIGLRAYIPFFKSLFIDFEREKMCKWGRG